MAKRLPKLSFHKASGLYYVRINGKPVYLGRDEAAAEKQRLRVLAEAKGGSRRPTGRGVTLLVLAAEFIEHADGYYRKADGTPTSEATLLRRALTPLLRLHGETAAADFTPAMLESVLLAMANGSWMDDRDRARGCKAWCRNQINKNLERVRRAFRWGVKRGLVPGDVYRDLLTVDGLQKGRSPARETADVPPAPDWAVEAIRATASPQVWAMVQLQLWSGMRPGEVCALRPWDIDATGEAVARLLRSPVPDLGRCWAYLPGYGERGGTDHKTAHHGGERIVPLGPEARAVLAPFLDGRAPDAFVFSPAEAREARFAEQRRRRKSRVPPSQYSRRKLRAKRRPGERYTASSYANAVARAIRKANALEAARAAAEGRDPVVIPHWHPHQLRHNAADRIERRFGEKVAALVLGHSDPRTTRRHYLTRDLESAFRAMSEAG